MRIEKLQKMVDDWVNTYGIRYFDEMTNLAILMEETGELARLFARKYGEQSFKQNISDHEIKEKISDEMADILFVLVCLANQTGVNLENAVIKNLEKKTKRDKSRHKNNPKLK
ncbi:MAG TPA: pyrophosphatase [Bacteroidetes bacterium]|nr:pyrophosphatase [Bacteroidota bacterium]